MLSATLLKLDEPSLWVLTSNETHRFNAKRVWYNVIALIVVNVGDYTPVRIIYFTLFENMMFNPLIPIKTS